MIRAVYRRDLPHGILGRRSTEPRPATGAARLYRAPTPATLAGARVVTTKEAEDLWKTGAAFVDVLPHIPRPANLPPGTIWHEKVRMNIPGSIWLPDTGYGVLAAETESYLRQGLERITNGDHARWLIIYCRRDCWMSWNAAKRALTMGYENVALSGRHRRLGSCRAAFANSPTRLSRLD